jgi:hypothetical protein
MMMVVIMLMYTVSFGLQFPSCVTIHNQCSDIKLISPIYFSEGVVCPKLSNQQIEIDALMNASFEISTAQSNFEGALLFKLQRYSGIRHNIDTSNTETSENKMMEIYMLAAWKVKDFESFTYLALIDHTNEFTWNEDKLKMLYYENHNRLKRHRGAISNTWLMDNNTVLKIAFRIIGLEDPKLSISIFEEKDDYAIRPLCINLKR